MNLNRHKAILEIIEREPVETQGQLTARLMEAGFKVTQATVSRDIKDLRLVKAAGPDGVVRYAFGSDNSGGFTSRLWVIFKEGVISVDSSGNMVVVKTISGVANAVAASIDSMVFPDILGTLAGDDTIFIMLRDAAAAAEFCASVDKILRG